MFPELLNDIQRAFPPILNLQSPTLPNMSDEEWTQKVEYFTKLLKEPMDYLQTSTHSILGCRMFKNSNKQFLSNRSQIHFIKAQIRCPEIEGIQISLSLYRSHLDGAMLTAPSLSVDLEITDVKETAALQSLYTNYRRIIEILINRGGLDLIYSFSHYKPEVFSGKSILTRLDNYFHEGNFSEKTLAFVRFFDVHLIDNKVLYAFVILASVYDSCIGYLDRPRQYDKILDYFYKVQSHQ